MKKVLVLKLFVALILTFTLSFAENINNKRLYKAAGKGDLEYVKKLVKSGKADFNYKTRSQKTPLMKAARKKRKKVVHYFLTLQDKKTKKRLVDFNAIDNNGETALHKACKRGHLYIVKMLLLVGAKTDVQNKDGCTPLYLAAKEGYFKIVKDLIKKKANISLADNKGRTPLHAAAKSNRLKVVKFLEKKGADPNSKDDKNRMPIDDSKRKVKEFLLQFF